MAHGDESGVLALLEGFTALGEEERPTHGGGFTEDHGWCGSLLASEAPALTNPSATRAQRPAHSTSSSSRNNAAKRKAQPRKVGSNPNRARNERREELVYLRSKVADLEAQLQQLKQGKAAQSKSSTASTSSVVLRSLEYYQQAHCPVWAEIASRQYAERQQAELKNIRLKMILEGQIKVAKGLEKLLNSKSNTQILQVDDDRRTQRRPRPQYALSNHEDEAEIFRMLIVDIEKAVTQVDDIFQENGLHNTEEAFQDASIRNDSSSGMYLEVIGCKIMPFDLQPTGEAVWKHIAGLIESMPFRAYYERRPKFMESTDDMIVETYDIELNSKQASAYFCVRKVLRRYVEQDRILISWRETMDPIEYASRPTSGIRFLEQGYVLIKRPTTAPSNYSVMQTCFHMRPHRYDQSQPEHEFVVGQLSNFFLDTLAGNIYFSHQMIENCLLDQSLARSTATAANGS